jgi:iron uptake system EfeUOB component EfeO/EfeM
MKERLKEAYIANYKARIDEKAQTYLEKVEKLENYAKSCIEDFMAKCEKGKHIVVCAQRPKVDELNKNLEKFDTAFSKMCENTKEYRGEF